jgi:hypothetical protein
VASYPGFRAAVDRRAGERIGPVLAIERHGQHLPFVVAGHVQPTERAQEISRFLRQQRAAQGVAQVDHHLRLAPTDVLQHGRQGGQVAVDVGDESDAHGGLQSLGGLFSR